MTTMLRSGIALAIQALGTVTSTCVGAGRAGEEAGDGGGEAEGAAAVWAVRLAEGSFCKSAMKPYSD